jgi:hypothetical protein
VTGMNHYNEKERRKFRRRNHEEKDFRHRRLSKQPEFAAYSLLDDLEDFNEN